MVTLVSTNPAADPGSRITITGARLGTYTGGSYIGVGAGDGTAWPVWYTATSGTTVTSTGTAASTPLVDCASGASRLVPIASTGAWINATVATTDCGTVANHIVQQGFIRASWVNGYLCLSGLNATTMGISVVPGQLAQIGVAPTQMAQLQKALTKAARDADRRWRAQQRRAVKATRAWAQAVLRAERLLLRHLDRQQRADYAADRHFFVRTNERVYEITHARAHNVFLLGPDGQRAEELCVVPVEMGCPTEDVLLAQKLWLDHMEDRVLAVANVWELRNNRRFRRGEGRQVHAA